MVQTFRNVTTNSDLKELVQYILTNDSLSLDSIDAADGTVSVDIDSNANVDVANGALTVSGGGLTVSGGAATVSAGGANGTGAVHFGNTTIRENSNGEIEVVDSAGNVTVVS